MRLKRYPVDDDARAAHRIEDGVLSKPAGGVQSIGEDQQQRPSVIERGHLQGEVHRVPERGDSDALKPGERASNGVEVLRHGHP